MSPRSTIFTRVTAPIRIAAAVAVTCCFTSVSMTAALAQPAGLLSHSVKVGLDSGIVSNHGSTPEVLWSTVVYEKDADWLRLYFDVTDLSHSADGLRSSIIRVTSLGDGAVQHLNDQTVQEWQDSTAYFNGDTVIVELIGLPGGGNNHVVIGRADAGYHNSDQGGIATICDNVDNRQLSDEDRSGRALPIGCTAWIIDDANHTMLTAGHCSGGSLQVIEFHVPLSNHNGSLNHPAPEDQYSVDGSSQQYLNGGIGNDFGYFGCFPNSETGLTAYQAEQDFYVLAATPPQVDGQTISITGYGVVSNPVPPEWNQVQKEASGSYYRFSGTSLGYRVDTSGGNSGSAVFCMDTQQAIGIHTHGGCNSSPGSYNSGTGINLPALQNALHNPQGVCAPLPLDIGMLTAGQNNTLQVSGLDSGDNVYFAYSTSTGSTLVNALGVTLGIRNPTLIGQVIADGNGVATLIKFIPNAAQGRTIYLQAAKAGRVTDVQSGTIQ